ncbi:hypothetical protein B0I26_10447 [Anoxybacillus vitaminiphilus]|uniref:asparagine synthase (glutamine-hydrolyzing) n=1 Tax=Paranoxybacillus vitaminiphilus TaxID=581036 RepID=A0A327YJL0_9BACL|nr:hypothetical protein [Anoxybacillus vitaminiphilus]RAK20396.1 hypothetical protein B0I26_10447 [Anoxybacillus vitaminiphilus]
MKQFETDWLGSKPIFYNEKTGKVSENINEVIDYNNLEFDPEGFNNYLEFGYSVFEQTPIKNVKFLRYSTRLIIDDNNKIHIKYLKDPAENWYGKTTSEIDVLERLEAEIQKWENSVKGEIIIPTSGGYDSRILNIMIKDKSRIKSFTYGISDNQDDSFEVVYAKKISEILNTKWKQIKLGHFHNYLDEWYQLYGVSTHAHGMYHMEFYSKILKEVSGGNPFLSGIIGDAWAGNVNIPDINLNTLNKLGYTHGMNADPKQSYLKSNNYLKEKYLEINKFKLKDPYWKVIESMRLKIILLSYLLRIPRYYGFNPWSPFIDINIALSMHTIPLKRKVNRAWQSDFFKKYSLNLEELDLKVNKTNSLNYQAMLISKLKPLNVELLREVINPSYVDWINKNVIYISSSKKLIRKLLNVKKLGGALRRSGIRDTILTAYCAYLTLKPIEQLLEKRNHFYKN